MLEQQTHTDAVFTTANRWLSCSWRSLRHACQILDLMAPVIRSANLDERKEGLRLFGLIQNAMSFIRANSPRVKDMPRSAFFQVAVFDDDSGECVISVDSLRYPEGCSLQQRMQIQFDEACRQMGFPVPSEEVEQAEKPKTVRSRRKPRKKV